MKTNFPWSAKYSPKTFFDLVGQSKAIGQLVNFCENFPQKKRAILLHGPAGCGKTAALKVLVAEKNYELIELNSSDFRNKNSIEEVLGPASNQASLFGFRKIIVLDELDGMSGTADRGAIPAIIKMLKESKFPVILIANDIWNTKFRALRLHCEIAEFVPVTQGDIFAVLRKICIAENKEFEDIALKKLSAASEGDVRAAINDLQIVASVPGRITHEKILLWGRDYEEKIFNALRLIFKSFDGRTAFNAVDDLKLLPKDFSQWLDHNIPLEYKNPREICDAYLALSDADIFESRIMRRQHWAFMLYVKYLLSAGVQQAKENARGGFQNYSKPEMMKMIFIRAAKNKKAKSIAEAFKGSFHASVSTIKKDYIPHLNFMAEANLKIKKDIDSMLEEISKK